MNLHPRAHQTHTEMNGAIFRLCAKKEICAVFLLGKDVNIHDQKKKKPY